MKYIKGSIAAFMAIGIGLLASCGSSDTAVRANTDIISGAAETVREQNEANLTEIITEISETTTAAASSETTAETTTYTETTTEQSETTTTMPPTETTETETTTTPVETTAVTTTTAEEKQAITYVLNTNTKKIHYQHCSSVKDIKDKNLGSTTDFDQAIKDGYVPCKRCNPKAP